MIKKVALIMTVLVTLLGASNVYAVVGSGDMLDNKDMIIVPMLHIRSPNKLKDPIISYNIEWDRKYHT